MAMQTKKGETKNQHYVPQFYQRNFSIDGKTIGAFVMSRGKFIQTAPIKTQSSSDYFYSENMVVEKALSAIEGRANNVIQKVIASPVEEISNEEALVLYVFTMIQAGRTVYQAELLKESMSHLLKTTIKKDIEIKRLNGHADEVADITEDDIDSLDLNFNSNGLMALGTQARVIDACIDLHRKIIINETDKAFITSDNPAVFYDCFMERMNQIYALGSRGLMAYLPLSPKVAILYYDSDCYKMGERKKKYVCLNSLHDVAELNKLIVVKASNVIYCNPDDYSE